MYFQIPASPFSTLNLNEAISEEIRFFQGSANPLRVGYVYFMGIRNQFFSTTINEIGIEVIMAHSYADAIVVIPEPKTRIHSHPFSLNNCTLLNQS